MKVRHRKELKSGKRHVLVELDANETLFAIDADGYYRLGGQVEDIVQGHVITEADKVYWCSITQQWEQA